ncbi:MULTISPECIES: helicase-related protein [Bacillaceae]|uniref:RNA helicase n=1 Tax=Evansella alkalicola TaxID=745819 RepID=A0ABS6JRN5_9BACI|nr:MULTISPECIES: helicase-related protein [Bacillaceae]MBU9721217.1 RNA helicase [Bacillus alkalicola]
MTKLTEVYEQAIMRTKEKVLEDIDNYLGSKEVVSLLSDYISDREKYLEQIWINVWLNKVTNDVSKKEKKSYLQDRGFVVEGVDKKLINHLFRTEMRTYKIFNVIQWLKSEYDLGGKGGWQALYSQARLNHIRNQKVKEIEAKKLKVRKDIECILSRIVDEEWTSVYIPLRFILSKELLNDIKNQKYKLIETIKIEEKLSQNGYFDENDYTFVKEFLYELTGSIEKNMYWEYETYEDVYTKIIRAALLEILYDMVNEEISEEARSVLTHSEKSFDHELSNVLQEAVFQIELDFMNKFKEEYFVDLITLAAIPFDQEIHQEIYEQNLLDRERRKEEELLAIQKEKEAEERMVEDIFGREYTLPLGRDIQYFLHIGETNTGKTHHALDNMKKADSGIYLAPLRLLALEVYDKLNSEGVSCGLKTGEEEKGMVGATHISCTVEMFHERDYYDCLVIDEAQMIADKDRGFSWYKAITQANAKEVHIIGSLNSKNMILQLLGDSSVVIKEYKRDIPLEVEQNLFRLKHTGKGDALVCFSRKKVLETASVLENKGHSVSMIYGSMPPETRKKQMERFISGETSVIVATDAIGMGLNLPIRRIVFLENEKFDGTRRRRLSSQEIKQIAGRAGRKGIYDVGKVAFTSDIKLMTRLLEQEDELVQTFTVAPTTSIFERFQRYSHDLGYFFYLWDKFESPKGTKKASLSEERELYTFIEDTEMEARLPLMELYGFLHLPFSKKEPILIKQWRDKMSALVKGEQLPEPNIKRNGLEELELSYKALGLHLLFLYRLGKGTEALYWERIREEISDLIHEQLKTDVKKIRKKCKHCGRDLPLDFKYQICDSCHWARRKRRPY